MKINGFEPSNIYKSFMGSTPKSADKANVKEAQLCEDRVEISSECADLNSARELARKSGVIDSVKETTEQTAHSANFEAVKNLVQSGEYSVDAKDVAASILKGRNFDSRA